jgi:hypothetical protein
MTVKITTDTMCQRSGVILLKDVILYNVLDLSGLYYGRDKKGEERAVLINDAAIMLEEYEDGKELRGSKTSKPKT